MQQLLWKLKRCLLKPTGLSNAGITTDSKKQLYSTFIFQKRRSFGESPIGLKFEELFFIQLQLITKNLVKKTQNKGTSFFYCR
jgi:hypothetical protein